MASLTLAHTKIEKNDFAFTKDYTYMKIQTTYKTITLSLLMMIFGAVRVMGYGESTSYVYQNAGEKKASDWGEIKWTDSNCATVIFDATKDMATAVGDLRVDAYINGSWVEIRRINVGELQKNNYKQFLLLSLMFLWSFFHLHIFDLFF